MGHHHQWRIVQQRPYLSLSLSVLLCTQQRLVPSVVVSGNLNWDPNMFEASNRLKNAP